MRIPEEIPQRLLLVKCLASNTSKLSIALCLVLFNAKTFNMIPLLALVLALYHNRVLVGNAVSTDAVLFGVVNVDKFGWDFSRK